MRPFPLCETMRGLPDGSCDGDECREERYLRGLLARVTLARGVVSRVPGLDAMLRARTDRADWFYARFGIKEGLFRAQSDGPFDGSFSTEVAPGA